MIENDSQDRATLLKGCWLRNKETIITACAPHISSLLESMPELHNHPQLDRVLTTPANPSDESVVLLVEECVIKDNLWDVFFRGLAVVGLEEVRTFFKQAEEDNELQLIQKRVAYLQDQCDLIGQRAQEELNPVQPSLEEARKSVQSSM